VKANSLSTRLALMFTAVTMATIGTLGTFLYDGLEKQLVLRDDAALVSRVEQIRTLLQDTDTLALVRERPRLFENMLGNREALLVLKFSGQAPLIEVNPGAAALPDLPVVPADKHLTLADVHRSVAANGIPFIAVAAAAKTSEPRLALQVVAGKVLSERTRMLATYRDRIVILAAIAALLGGLIAMYLVRRGLQPLRDLASQAESITIERLGSRIDNSEAPEELDGLIAALNAMSDRLSTGFDQLSEVSTDMAHDLRTPISNLLGQTEVALGQPRTADYYENLLASNLEELQRLSTMTGNMLFLAHSEQPGNAIERRSLDVADELQRVADYFEGLAQERMLNVRFEGNGVVWADPLLLRRALANLMSNAVRHAQEGTTITLRACDTGMSTRIDVENHGPTIVPAQLARLFDRFYRVDRSRRDSSDANGLGLSIVRSIMTMHNGTSSASSHDFVTCFTLVFPRASFRP
jgi:two-component system heavy metal sensor histidine kinase CusS